MAGVLPAFQNVVLFPEQQSQQQQQPPSSLHNMSSSAFAFPRLLEESAIWTDDDLVPALFALGCLSKSLGGEVRVCARAYKIR